MKAALRVMGVLFAVKLHMYVLTHVAAASFAFTVGADFVLLAIIGLLFAWAPV
jgi:hypothetical protein